ncbi:uncharacterized protein DUF4194 [Brevibacterium sanguinis]|uniref:Uncharacterized protein DUF4194 n=2 Tax=Brevibacterium TaxID=1696 RepID=A0A366IGB1_9MICO|nr:MULTISPECIES: DUF4194 domain-containing protein [Brevibacterium]RBP62550.1 uncharacterized protein DUF4194 [Brevibacterium sanguinis]RBP69214.1 uncharacterized protein DUF4194 [Brevibacterium celere]
MSTDSTSTADATAAGDPSAGASVAGTSAASVVPGSAEETQGPGGLWTGDTGVLGERTRRVLLELLKGPYVSGAQSPQLWSALVADEDLVRSRLHELFLDLVIDKVDEFAFTRKVLTEEIEVPAAVRSERLTFIDTAMLLVLRQLLLAAPGEKRVIIDREEVFERLEIYRRGDESTFLRNLNAAWTRMSNKLRVLHKAGEGRYEISPMVRFLVDEDRVRELTEVYRRIAVGESGVGDHLGEDAVADSSDDTTDTDTVSAADAGEDAE